MGRKKLTTEQFIEKAKEVHQNKYLYNKTIYNGSNNKVIITCPEHGDFEQAPNNHLHGNRCPKCARNQKCTLNDFITKSRKVHGDKYDYSKVKYIDKRTKVCIICPEHGEFWQTPDSHINSRCGCPKCVNKQLNTEEWINKAEEVHNYKYNYSKTIYTGGHNNVLIICPKHGEFCQQATSHLMGCGCPKCKNEKLHDDRAITTSEFIHKANKIHNYYYNYDKVKYVNDRTPVVITCPRHGDFTQIPNNHLKGHGCSKCNRFCVISKGEQFILEYLNNNCIKYIRQYCIEIPTNINSSGFAQCDFYLPDYNTIIEYNGEQHYKYTPYFHRGGLLDFERQQKRDNYIRNYCKKESINLIEIKYTQDFNDIQSILKDKLAVAASQKL